MKTHLMDYVFLDPLFETKDCKDWIRRLELSEWNQHRWYNSNKKTISFHHDFLVQNHNTVNAEMMPAVRSFAERYFDTFSSVRNNFTVNPLRFNKYEEGNSMELHIDHTRSLFDGERRGIPIASIIGCLNSDYSGGKFELCQGNVNIPTGCAIMFPSVFLYPHEVTEVTRGTRYSWVTWVY